MNSRELAVGILDRWEGEAGFIDALVHEAFRRDPGIEERERHFIQEVVYGVVRHLRRLDWLIDRLCERKLERRVRNILRCGVYQVLDMRVADHAAVHESVELAGRARGLVNAVLRRLLRERDALVSALGGQPPGVLHSHPDHLVERWTAGMGEERTLKLLEWNNARPHIHARANRLVEGSIESLSASDAATPVEGEDAVFRLERIEREWIDKGYCYIQDPSTLVACRLLAPLPGDRVLDACAAPGGKTAYLAEQMENLGSLVACDSDPERLSVLGGNLSRMGVDCAELVLVDWEDGGARSRQVREALKPGSFQRILVDAPCSNSGVLQRRPDARWRLDPGDFETMRDRQLAIVASVLPLLARGGQLVYSTCSIDPVENESVAAEVVRRHPFRLLREVRTTPWDDGMDGAYAALFE